MINMAVYIIFLIPSIFLLDNVGLRTILVLGAGLNALGNIIKCVSILPNLFWIGKRFYYTLFIYRSIWAYTNYYKMPHACRGRFIYYFRK